jgi:hypothetical protein
VSGPVRRVRATPDFFRDLDRQLPADRGLRGLPSRSDFETYELLPIVETFATGFDDLPLFILGRSDYRLLLIKGTLVYAISVLAHLASDGAVELLRLSLDTETPWPDEDEEHD